MSKCEQGADALGWQPASTAPTDRVILACFGFPWPVVAVFNSSMQQWVTAEVEQGTYNGESDPSFVTEWFPVAELVGWMPLPPPVLPERLRQRFYRAGAADE